MAEDFGKLLLRLSLGGLLLFHGIHKLLVGIAPIKDMLVAHNIPEYLAYGVYLGELAAPVLIIIGLFSRVGGLLIAFNMIVALALVHVNQFAALTPDTVGYALELQVFYLVGGLAVALLGAGKIAIGGEHLN